jgi:hypothetical protein
MQLKNFGKSIIIEVSQNYHVNQLSISHRLQKIDLTLECRLSLHYRVDAYQSTSLWSRCVANFKIYSQSVSTNSLTCTFLETYLVQAARCVAFA